MLLAIHLVMIMVFVILGVIFLNGKGAFLIAGYNTTSKAENQMEWVRQMNACKAQAEEIVKAELIYD